MSILTRETLKSQQTREMLRRKREKRKHYLTRKLMKKYHISKKDLAPIKTDFPIRIGCEIAWPDFENTIFYKGVVVDRKKVGNNGVFKLIILLTDSNFIEINTKFSFYKKLTYHKPGKESIKTAKKEPLKIKGKEHIAISKTPKKIYTRPCNITLEAGSFVSWLDEDKSIKEGVIKKEKGNGLNKFFSLTIKEGNEYITKDVPMKTVLKNHISSLTKENTEKILGVNLAS